MKTFIDNFSKQADSYQKFRPSYPSELFEFLSSLTSEHQLSWDCGTGNGQSANSLTNYYEKIFATDPSAQQIDNAKLHKQITYKAETAENTSLENKTVDLITVAQAVHWFEFDNFYSEVKRVLKQNGIIAVWAYGLPTINNSVDEIIKHFHDNIVGEFWQAQNRLIEKEYKTIPFPFEQISTPNFYIKKELTFFDILGLLKSWSATQKYIDKHHQNPIDLIENELLEIWGEKEIEKSATWKLILMVGRNACH